MRLKNLEDLFESFKKVRVLVIGDVMLDHYLYGRVDRISPEAPVPVIIANEERFNLGGAGNVASNLVNLGAIPTLVGVVGSDDAGKRLKNLMTLSPINNELVTIPGRKTTVKQRIIGNHQHIGRVDDEDHGYLAETDQNQVIEKLARLAANCDVIILEDYNKGLLSAAIIEETIKIAKKNKKKLVADPKKGNFLRYSGVDLFKPSATILKRGLNLAEGSYDNQQIIEAVKTLRKMGDYSKVMITRSEKGIYMSDKQSHHFIHGHSVQNADNTGASDTVVSLAALCEALEVPLNTQAELSNLAGGIVCKYPGVVPIKTQELLEEAKRMNIVIPRD